MQVLKKIIVVYCNCYLNKAYAGQERILLRMAGTCCFSPLLPPPTVKGTTMEAIE